MNKLILKFEVLFLPLFLILLNEPFVLASDNIQCGEALSFLNGDLFNDEVVEDLESLIFQTSKVQLRPITISDANEATQILTNSEVNKMSGDHLDKFVIMQILSIGKTKFEQLADSKKRLINFGIYQDQELIGLFQIVTVKKSEISKLKIDKPFKDWVSISYHLVPSAWGKGIATEVVGRLVRFIFNDLNARGIYAKTIKSNIGSQRILEKLSFQKAMLKDSDLVHFYLRQTELSQKY
jgi:RimJ/RimL family protein N-acetyltransferase